MHLPSASAFVDPNEQEKIATLVEQLKSGDTGWQMCADALTDRTTVVPQQLFVCMQVMEDYLRRRYAHATNDEQQTVRQFMTGWLQRLTSDDTAFEAVFLKNKMAQVFSLIFVVDFPHRWPAFFQAVFLPFVVDYPVIAEFYLRVLMAVDCEVADREIRRSKEEIDRNTVVKDSMRELCVKELVESWYCILTNVTTAQNTKVQSLCLNVIGAYVSWIEVTLIANPRIIPLIVALLRRDDTQEAAVDCVCSILSKGMLPANKVELVQAMDAVLEQSGVYRPADVDDIEAHVRVAELVNCIGTELIDCYKECQKCPPGSIASTSADSTPQLAIMKLIEGKLDLMLSCLSHADNDVSGSVTEFSRAYVILLKQQTTLNEAQTEFLRNMLVSSVQKYRFPEDYNHDLEGELEADFLEYRKDIKTIFMNIGMLNSELLVSSIEELVTGTLANWKSYDYRDIELALALIFFVGDVVPVSLFTSADVKAVKLRNMVRLSVTSGVSHHKHIAVALEYFELLCRYEKIFGVEPSLIRDSLASFLDERGLRHASRRVRTRAAYLFSRYVKSQKSLLNDYVDQILTSMSDLLAIGPELIPMNDRLIGADDQLFLYEATGSLIVHGSFNAQTKRDYMRRLVGNLVEKFHGTLMSLPASVGEPKQRAALFDFLNHIIAYTSRATKAFSSQMSMRNCQCSDIFLELMQTFLSSITTENAALLDGFRQYLHRMVICLESELLPHLEVIFIRVLTVAGTDLKAQQDFLVLVQQLISKFKANAVPPLLPVMPRVFDGVWRSLTDQQYDLEDEAVRRDLTYLRRAYYQLLNCAVVHRAYALFLSADGGEQRPLATILDGAADAADAPAQRQCFSVLQKLAAFAADGDGKSDAPEVVTLRAWFAAMATAVTTVCLRAPMDAQFDLTDAQCALTLGEIAACLHRFYKLMGDQWLTMCTDQLMSDLPNEVKAEFAASVKTLEPKPLLKYLKTFFGRLKRS